MRERALIGALFAFECAQSCAHFCDTARLRAASFLMWKENPERWLWTQSAANRSLDPYSLFNREFTGKMIERIPSRWPVPSEKAAETRHSGPDAGAESETRTGNIRPANREILSA
jgi:hypothetical protein